MKKIMTLCLTALMVVGMTACGSEASGGSSTSAASGGGSSSGEQSYAGQTLVVQVWGGTYEETLRSYAIPAFEEKPGPRLKL